MTRRGDTRSTRVMRSLVGASAVVLAMMGDARAVSTDIVAGPASYQTGRFATVAAVAQSADEPTFVNADLTLHSVESVLTGSDDQPWCGPVDPSRPEGPGNPRRYELGGCPLFWSEIVSSRSSAPVLGLEEAAPGATYAFTCAVFPDMRGLLAIVE